MANGKESSNRKKGTEKTGVRVGAKTINNNVQITNVPTTTSTAYNNTKHFEKYGTKMKEIVEYGGCEENCVTLKGFDFPSFALMQPLL